jgi:hypothetical protein
LTDSSVIRRRHGKSVSSYRQLHLRPTVIHDRLRVACFSLTIPLTADRSSWAECRTPTLFHRHRSGECRTEPSGNQPPRNLPEPPLNPCSNTMAEEKPKEPALPDLPVALRPQDRLELEMVVLDKDPLDAREFLHRLGIEIGDADDPLALCKRWLKRIHGGERGKLRIRYDDKGPTMDLSQ